MPYRLLIVTVLVWSCVTEAAGPGFRKVDKLDNSPKQASIGSQEAPPEFERFLSLRAKTLTGEWGGVRPALEEKGIRINAFYNDQYQAVVNGGLDANGSGRNGASIDILIGGDLERLGVMNDADFLLHLQATFGYGINRRTGALQQVNDDADGDKGLYVAQAWIRKHWLANRLSLQIGYLDFQTIVDRNAYSNSEDKQFWHQALDNNSLVPLTIGMGVTLTFRPVNWYTLILGVADAQSIPYKGGVTTAFHDEDWFRVYIENDFHVKVPSARGPLPGNYRVGTFYEPGTRTVFSRSDVFERTRSGDWGFYLSFDQLVFRENDRDDQGLGLFTRFAYRNPESNRLSHHYSAGCQYKGLVPERDEDVLGFAFLFQRSSHHYRHLVDREFSDETVYELYYAYHVTKWLVISPDIQYIDNPGGRGDVGHTMTAGVRMRTSF